MAEIALTNGGVALVDDDDADVVGTREWKRMTVAKDYHYVIGRGRSRLLLHRFLMQPAPGFVVDHINGDGMDNRRANLRVCTHAENMRNKRKPVFSKSPFKGVYFRANKKTWIASIGSHRHSSQVFLGCFSTAEEAAAAYDIAAVLRYGEFACLNFPHVFPEVPSRRKA